MFLLNEKPFYQEPMTDFTQRKQKKQKTVSLDVYQSR